MTVKMMNEFKSFAKKACKENGIKVFMKDMTLLESGSNADGRIDYVMFEDRKTGREFQCCFGARFYTESHRSLYLVTEYKEA